MAEPAEEERAGAGSRRRACPRRPPAPAPGTCAPGRPAARPAPAAVRVGLGRVFGLAEATGERIVAARAERPFRTLADFMDRVRPTLPELESLILAGALDCTGRTRPSLLLEARVGAHRSGATRPRAARPRSSRPTGRRWPRARLPRRRARPARVRPRRARAGRVPRYRPLVQRAPARRLRGRRAARRDRARGGGARPCGAARGDAGLPCAYRGSRRSRAARCCS